MARRRDIFDALGERDAMVAEAAARMGPQRAAMRVGKEARSARRQQRRTAERMGFERGFGSVCDADHWADAKRMMMISSDIERLDAGEKCVFRRLKAFAPGAAEVLTSGEPGGDIQCACVLGFSRGIAEAFRAVEAAMDEAASEESR